MARAIYLAGVLSFASLVVGDLGCDDCADVRPCAGSYDISGLSDHETIARCESISENLLFEGQPGFTNVDLRCLASVGGDLSISDSPTMTSLDLTALTSVGGDLSVRENPALTSLDLPALMSVGGTSSITDNASLTAFELPVLASVGSGLSIPSSWTSCWRTSRCRTLGI